MRTVSNASPLIFLAKCDGLRLIGDLFGADVLVPELVRDEVLASPVTSVERRSLERFLASCRVVPDRPTSDCATALSAADNAVVALARTEDVGIVLADDLLLRELVAAEGRPVIGTLGVLIRAVDCQVLPAARARASVDALVSAHGFRISVALYARVLAELADRGGP